MTKDHLLKKRLYIAAVLNQGEWPNKSPNMTKQALKYAKTDIFLIHPHNNNVLKSQNSHWTEIYKEESCEIIG